MNLFEYLCWFMTIIPHGQGNGADLLHIQRLIRDLGEFFGYTISIALG